MKLSPIQIEQLVSSTSQIPAESFVEQPALNDVQKCLRLTLDWWGPNGERWCAGVKDDLGCTVTAFEEVTSRELIRDPAYEFLDKAATEQGFSAITLCSDSSFENARKMVLHAISLAGEIQK